MRLLPNDYFQSRERFRALAHAAGGQLNSFSVPSAVPANSGLSVDSAYLGDEAARNVLVIISGVHGVEAYAGSACIQHFLQRYKTDYRKSGNACLLVHALNPWGFANDSRVTEDNIDLNRNFVDFARPLPSSLAYSRFHARLCEDYRPGPGGWANELRLLSGLMRHRNRRAFQEAATAGQYHYQNGLFYGGMRATQNREIWDRIAREYLRPGQNIRFLDIHTGLGQNGHGALLTHLPPTSAKFQALNTWLDGQASSTAEAGNISAFVSGHLPGYVEERFGDRCVAITLEFGVASPLFTLNALRADNWLRTTQDKKSAALRKPAIKERMRRAFLCDDPGWEEAILNRFAWTIERLMHSFREDPASPSS